MKFVEIEFSDAVPVRLATFVRRNMKPIVDEWTDFADTRTPASKGMTLFALRDHISEILAFVVEDMESSQTGDEQLQKSQGDGPRESGIGQSPAEVHADLRLSDGFDIDQMVSEYRALRACIVKLWRRSNHIPDNQDLDDLVRLNEAIDQAVTESVGHYTKTLEHSRNMFLGILGHDLRNPLAAVSASASRVATAGATNEQQSILVTQIEQQSSRATGVLDDLLDLTRVQFGSELPLYTASMDMAALSLQLVDEMRAAYPDRAITLDTAGDMMVEWDIGRIGQVLSNLIGNAVAHGSKDTPVQVSVNANDYDVVLSVQNQGAPIPEEKLRGIFNPLMRGDGTTKQAAGSTHLGLGLYITSKIVGSHRGTVKVTSTMEDGTTFAVRIPRRPLLDASEALDRRRAV